MVPEVSQNSQKDDNQMEKNLAKKWHTLRYVFISSFLFNGYTGMSFAQTTLPYHHKIEPHAIIYLGIPYSFLNEQTMAPQGVGDGFGLLSIGLDAIFKNYFLVGAQLGWDSPKDEKKFINITSAGEMSSSISLWNFSLLSGFKSPHLPFSPKSYLFGNMNLGYSWLFFEERSIQNCLDCDKDEITINGGSFIEPELYYVINVFSLGLGYKHYFNSDYKGKIELKLSAVVE